jgi:hypothetical protein
MIQRLPIATGNSPDATGKLSSFVIPKVFCAAFNVAVAWSECKERQTRRRQSGLRTIKPKC